MTIIAYFDCYSGASGDLLLGALTDNAVDFNWFKNELQKLNLPEGSFDIEKTYVTRNSINSCKLNIILKHKEHTHRGYSSICKILDNAQINPKAKELAQKIFYKIATAEAKIHQKTIEEIHFHEVGALDSIIDIAGFSICYTSLKIDRCFVSPVPVGSGEVKCAHGTLPVPAPATLEIIKNHRLVIKNNDKITGECLTPTGAAILATIADEYSCMPDMDKVLSIGYGAGDRIFDGDVTSNLRFVLGEINI